MNKNNVNYLLVGVFVIAMATVLVVVLFQLTGRGNDTDPYFALFNKVTNIQEGSTVTYSGYPVGYVDHIEPVRSSGKTQYNVELAIKKNWKIPTDSVAKIFTPGMLADTIIEIQEGRLATMIHPGKSIATEETLEFTQLMGDAASEIKQLSANKIQPLIQTMQDAIIHLGTSMDDNLKQVSEKTLILLERLDKNSQALSKLASHDNAQLLTSVLENADQLTREFATTVKGLGEVGKKLDNLLNEGDQIVTGNKKDIRTSIVEVRDTMQTISGNIESIVYQMDNTSRNMSEFSRRIKENPSSLLQGRPLEDHSE